MGLTIRTFVSSGTGALAGRAERLAYRKYGDEIVEMFTERSHRGSDDFLSGKSFKVSRSFQVYDNATERAAQKAIRARVSSFVRSGVSWNTLW
ncbi:hypothetical protein Aab01nite_65520 [Paractinoplanes abujensis]|nr:hypothetical protein Aab01nite_65520 [Actinoplanes abujensis]